MGIGGAVIYSLIVRAIQKILLAIRWLVACVPKECRPVAVRLARPLHLQGGRGFAGGCSASG